MNSEPQLQLTPEERTACLAMANGDSLAARRAVALLALHEGATQPLAAERCGLSAGQVRYTLRRFREVRLQVLEAAIGNNAAENELQRKAIKAAKKAAKREKKEAKKQRKREKKEAKKAAKAEKRTRKEAKRARKAAAATGAVAPPPAE